jgi:spore coat polysaccharide biosynthesis protein SpsF
VKRVCVVQARMGSTRFPGKVLRDLGGRPMLAQVVRRLRRCESLDEIVIATSVAAGDDAIAEAGASEGVMVVRGSEMDVLSRMLAAARATDADVVVRVTSDCPLIDPRVTDRVIDALLADVSHADYASNVQRRTFPRGLDVEAMFLDTLMRLDRLARTPSDREHVTTALRSGRPDLFLSVSVESAHDDSDLRWTVDEERDLELVSNLYDALSLGDGITPYETVVGYVRQHPELLRINEGIETWTPPTQARQ